MSFFMPAMDGPGLMSSPPVSYATPFPTSVTFGCEASPHVKSISRGSRPLAAARPTVWIWGKFSWYTYKEMTVVR